MEIRFSDLPLELLVKLFDIADAFRTANVPREIELTAILSNNIFCSLFMATQLELQQLGAFSRVV